MIEAPRINKWARMVVEIDRISRDGGVFIAQTEKHCHGILAIRGRLLSIYLAHWDAVDIGYPNVVAILHRWAVEPSVTVENPIKYIRDLEMYVLSIDLDMLAVNAAVEDNAAEAEAIADAAEKEDVS